jgi:hypothetical protein
MVVGSNMIDSSLILDRHRVHLRGSFAIHHPGEYTAKLKPFRVYQIASFPLLRFFISMAGTNINQSVGVMD